MSGFDLDIHFLLQRGIGEINYDTVPNLRQLFRRVVPEPPAIFSEESYLPFPEESYILSLLHIEVMNCALDLVDYRIALLLGPGWTGNNSDDMVTSVLQLPFLSFILVHRFPKLLPSYYRNGYQFFDLIEEELLELFFEEFRLDFTVLPHISISTVEMAWRFVSKYLESENQKIKVKANEMITKWIHTSLASMPLAKKLKDILPANFCDQDYNWYNRDLMLEGHSKKVLQTIIDTMPLFFPEVLQESKLYCSFALQHGTREQKVRVLRFGLVVHGFYENYHLSLHNLLFAPTKEDERFKIDFAYHVDEDDIHLLTEIPKAPLTNQKNLFELLILEGAKSQKSGGSRIYLFAAALAVQHEELLDMFITRVDTDIWREHIYEAAAIYQSRATLQRLHVRDQRCHILEQRGVHYVNFDVLARISHLKILNTRSIYAFVLENYTFDDKVFGSNIKSFFHPLIENEEKEEKEEKIREKREKKRKEKKRKEKEEGEKGEGNKGNNQLIESNSLNIINDSGSMIESENVIVTSSQNYIYQLLDLIVTTLLSKSKSKLDEVVIAFQSFLGDSGSLREPYDRYRKLLWRIVIEAMPHLGLEILTKTSLDPHVEGEPLATYAKRNKRFNMLNELKARGC